MICLTLFAVWLNQMVRIAYEPSRAMLQEYCGLSFARKSVRQYMIAINLTKSFSPCLAKVLQAWKNKYKKIAHPFIHKESSLLTFIVNDTANKVRQIIYSIYKLYKCELKLHKEQPESRMGSFMLESCIECMDD
jgi:hypothetical protein